MHEMLTVKLQDIVPVKTAHGLGEKFVFLTKQDTPTQLTQAAFGTLSPGEVCPMHIHPTMEEYFYFIEGTGMYTVGNEEILLTPGTFVRIPAGVAHAVKADGASVLHFFYFGIALSEG